MKKFIIFVCFTVISIQTSALELSECRIGADNTRKIKAECGKLSVAENRGNPSRMIDLNIAVIRSKSTNKHNDPVIMLAGGPGQAAVEAYSGASFAFHDILKHRDVVLVDQRGTGGSNIIKCDFDAKIQKALLIDPSLIAVELKKCVDGLDADTRYYTTIEAIKDLEQVRQALEIEKWNLLGISYGTRKALTYIKMYPGAIRSVILDGVMPQQEAMPQSHEKNLINALRKQFAQCVEQPACSEAFGDVEQQMWQLLDTIDSGKPKIRLQNFTTGEYEKITLTKESIAIAIRMFAYSANSMNLLPLMIDKANHGQPETIASQANMISSLLSQSISNVELSIICAEDLPFYSEYTVNENNLFGDLLSHVQESCSVWPHITVDASFKEPVVSDLPVLLLSGELDPVTPPEFAELAMQTLSNSQHLIAKGQGHNVFPLGCMPDIITSFIADPETELDTECMEDFNYTPFFINMMGPTQ
ncbi:FIG032621: Hydrolase, alpha/beta hydrolase fold family [hydrothermal vent metagenome]|uniref:prolyl aminopeptidase n=1 Tax=hydrothermal vent metagenome TaxID=652676 RepID=A0A3B0VN07_9ZZZZ